MSMEQVTALLESSELEYQRNRDQLGILAHQNEKLNRELEELRRERRVQASANMELLAPQLQHWWRRSARPPSCAGPLRSRRPWTARSSTTSAART